MSFSAFNATVPPSSLSAHAGDPLMHELAALVEDIQRTKDWFINQLDSQLASLNQLREAMQIEAPARSPSMAALFEAPAPVIVPPAPAAPAKTNGDQHGVHHSHQAIVLPPTMITALDPELEQATLHELNNALTRAFSEISARGGMLG